jgi:hypothetical protein
VIHGVIEEIVAFAPHPVKAQYEILVVVASDLDSESTLADNSIAGP